jgi:hypothetical protein
MPGWALLPDRTNLALVRARRTRRSVAVLVIDSPRGVAGDGTPDAVAFAGALRSVLRPDDTVARIDGNTYVAVCRDVCREEDAARIGQRALPFGGLTRCIAPPGLAPRTRGTSRLVPADETSGHQNVLPRRLDAKWGRPERRAVKRAARGDRRGAQPSARGPPLISYPFLRGSRRGTCLGLRSRATRHR